MGQGPGCGQHESGQPQGRCRVHGSAWFCGGVEPWPRPGARWAWRPL
jgi:hypothetical protein